MDQIVEDFRRYIVANRSKATATQYISILKRFVPWLTTKGYGLSDAPVDTLVVYCQEMKEQGYKPATVLLHQAAIDRFLQWCKSQNYSVPLFSDPEAPRVRTKVKSILTPEQIQHYFRLANEIEEPTRSAVLLLPCTGLRGEEMAQLPIHGSLRRTQLRYVDGSSKSAISIVVTGKGGDERIVPMLTEGAQIAVGYLSGWRKMNPDAKWFFPSYRGDHIEARTLRAALQRIREPLGFEFTPHTMRRTYLTTLYRNGVDTGVIAKIAGHKSVDTLLKHYLALDEQDLVGAVHATGGNLIAT